MVQTTKPALTATEGENRSECESKPDMSPPQSRLLRLPAEVRVMIYSLLFSDLRVTIARSAQLPNKGPWNIFLTCRKCCTEALPLFYQLATISVEPEAYVYVLRRKIGQQNMASLRSLSVRVNNRMGSETAALFPATLARLSIEWKSVMALFGTPSKSRLSDEDIHRTLDSRHRAFLTSCVMELWTKNPRLQIYLNVVVDQNSSPKVYSPENPTASLAENIRLTFPRLIHHCTRSVMYSSEWRL